MRHPRVRPPRLPDLARLDSCTSSAYSGYSVFQRCWHPLLVDVKDLQRRAGDLLALMPALRQFYSRRSFARESAILYYIRHACQLNEQTGQRTSGISPSPRRCREFSRNSHLPVLRLLRLLRVSKVFADQSGKLFPQRKSSHLRSVILSTRNVNLDRREQLMRVASLRRAGKRRIITGVSTTLNISPK